MSQLDMEPSIAPDGRPRRHARRRLRTHLLSLANLAAHDAKDEWVDGSSTSTRTTPRERLSRSESLISHLSSNRGSTTTRLSSLRDSRLTLVVPSIVGDLPSSARPLGVLEEKVQAERLGSPTNRSHTWHPRKITSDGLSIAARRRRSMFTPGVATRGSLQPLPAHQTDGRLPRSSWHTLGLQAPVMTTAVEAEDHRPASTHQRASTPCDLDYAHLGCFARGSLRVTNGPASPVPSTVNSIRQPAVDPADTFDHQPGSFPFSSDLPHDRAKKPADPHPSTVEALRRSTGSDIYEIGPSTPAGHPDELAQLDERASPTGQVPPLEDVEPTRFPPRQVGSRHRPDVLTSKRPSPPDQGAGGPPDLQIGVPSAIVQEYLAELPSHPSSRSGQTRPSDEASVDRPELADVGSSDFEDEGIEDARRVYPGGKYLPYRKDMASGRPLFRSSTEPMQSSSRPPSLLYRITTDHVVDRRDLQPSSAKVDSGYGSNASLRSLHELPADDVGRGDGRPSLARQASSVYTQDPPTSPSWYTLPSEPRPPVPPKPRSSRWSVAALPTTTTTTTPDPILRRHQTIRTSQPNPPLLPVGRRWDEAPPTPPKDVDRSFRPSVPTTVATTHARSTPRKLRKPMPASVQARRNSTQDIPRIEPPELPPPVPPIPTEMAVRHTERIRSAPPTETVSTGLDEAPSTDDGWPAPDGILANISFPGQVDSPDGDGREHAARRRRRSSLGAVFPALRHRFSFSSRTLKSVDEPTLATDRPFAIDGLGDGRPDDSTMPFSGRKFSERLRLSSSERMRMYKTKSMVEMSGRNEEWSGNATQEESSPSLDRHRSRPHSFHLASFSTDPSGQLRRSRRPVSMVTDAPPVPSLPSVLLQDERLASNLNLLAPPIPPEKGKVVADGRWTAQKDGGSFGPMTNGPGPPRRSAVKGQSLRTYVLKTMAQGGSRSDSRIPTTTTTTSSFSPLQHTHELDLRDVPVYIQG